MGTENKPPPLYVVSGGTGASGEQLVRTVLAQFPDNDVLVRLVGNVRHRGQLESVAEEARGNQGAIVFTLVDVSLGKELLEIAACKGVPAFDLMSPLIDYLASTLGRQPVGRPGLYRQLNQAYFDRVAAIEYTMVHDDGRNAEGWEQAGIVLLGVSRTGKTPLSLYMSVLGWKVANVPLVPGVEPREELQRLDPARVIGLKIEPGQLIQLRQQRQKRLGVSGSSAYTDPAAVYEEVEWSVALMRRAGFSIIDVTDKPIETSADEIIRQVTKRFPQT